MVLIREKPVTPPSKLALTFRQITQPGIREDMRTLSRNSNFLLTGAAFMIIWGNYITMGNVLTPLFRDQYSSSKISIIGAIFVITGVIGCYLMGLYVDRTQKHLTAIRFVSFGMSLLFLIAIFIIPIGVLWITCIFAFFAGSLNVPILPSSYAFVSK